MKHLKLLSLLIIAFATTTLTAETKRYEVKSGIIEYTITLSGNMMGMKMQGKGTAITLFKEWGNVELHSEDNKINTMGMTEHSKEITKIDNAKVYSVDFDQKVIYELSVDALVNSEQKDLIQTGKEMLISMGGKKIAEEKFMGYNCEVWEMMNVKTWLYKGIMLKSEADMMGIKNMTVANKIELDVSIPDERLNLPNFPIQKGQKQDKIPQMTPEQMLQMQEMMKSFSQK